MAVIQYHGASPEPFASKEASKLEADYVSSSEFHAEDFLLKGKEQAQVWKEEAERFIREKPRAALFVALGVGFVLRRLPVARILSTQLKLTAKMLTPAIFAFGAAKVYEAVMKTPKSR